MPHSAVTALPIHKYRYAAENAAVVRQILDALSRHLKQEVVTNMEEPLRIFVSGLIRPGLRVVSR